MLILFGIFFKFIFRFLRCVFSVMRYLLFDKICDRNLGFRYVFLIFLFGIFLLRLYCILEIGDDWYVCDFFCEDDVFDNSDLDIFDLLLYFIIL